MTLLRKIKFLFFIFFLISCVKTVKIDLPPYESELFVLGIIQPDSLVHIFVNKTVPLDDPQSVEYVDNALVILEENNTEVDTLTFDMRTRNYWSDYRPVEGKTYQLQVLFQDMRATGQTDIPAAPDAELRSLTIKNVMSEEALYEALEVKLLIKDEPGKENFYALKIHNITRNENLITELTVANDPAIRNEGDFRYDDEYFFNDVVFDGQSYELVSYFSNVNLHHGDSLSIQVFSLNREAYLWKRFRKNRSNYNDFLGQEPDFMPDNINGGIGIFSAKNVLEIKTVFP